MLQSFIKLPSMCSKRAAMDGRTFEPATDNAFRTEYVTRGRLLRIPHALTFYKSHMYHPKKNRNYEIVFASDHPYLTSSDAIFWPTNRPSMMIPIYVRDRSAIVEPVFTQRVPCALHVPNINEVLKYFGCTDTVMSLAQVIKFIVHRSYNVNLSAIPYSVLEGDIDERWATLQLASDDVFEASEEDNAERLQTKIDEGCVHKTQFPVEINLLFDSIRHVSDLLRYLDANFNASIPNVLDDSARQLQKEMEIELKQDLAFNELGDHVVLEDINRFKSVPWILNMHAAMQTSEFTITPPDWGTSRQLVAGADPLLNMMPVSILDQQIELACSMSTMIASNTEPMVGFEHIMGNIVSTYSENIIVTHRDDPGIIVLYIFLPLWILASGGGLINSEVIRGLE